jgi:hypothetical protein
MDMAEEVITPDAVLEAEPSEFEQKIKLEYEEKFEIWKAKDLAALREENDKKVQEQVKKLFDTWQKEQKPPSLEDIKVLLDQEYGEVPIQIPIYDDNDEKTIQKFVIRELPQSIERKFYKQFKSRVKDKGPEISAFTQRNMDQPFEKQLDSFLETFDGAFDILADAVVLILNPRGKKPQITQEWVADNIASNRMYSIIMAQVEVNRLRDFFSRVFQSGQKASTMMTPLNFQQLQALVR